MRGGWKKAAIAVTVAGAFVAGGATWAAASTPDATGHIQACYRLDTGALRVRDAGKKVAKCDATNEKAVSWAQEPSALTLGLETVVWTFKVPSGQALSEIVACPDGKYAIAGGVDTKDSLITVTKDAPIGGKWIVAVVNGDSAARDVDAYAQCIRA